MNLGDGRTAKAIGLGREHTCAILDDDSLKCWGYNDSGRLGDGTTTHRSTPTAVGLGDGRTAKAIGLGQYHTCAILDDDSLKCWGSNGSGRLGDGTSTSRHSPTAVGLGDGRTAKAISLGDDHTCAILDDNSLKCWGSNGSGRLRDGTSTSRHSPTAVNLGVDRTAKTIALGSEHTCAVLDDDSLKCWGDNEYGQLGKGTSTRQIATTVDLGNMRTAKSITTQDSHTCSILDDGSLKCWGHNRFGQLGDGTTTDRHSPTAVNLGDGRTATAISLGNNHTCAILDDDSLKCWGFNGFGRLGDGTTTDRHSPTAVNLGDSRTAKAIGLGQYHTCAILDDNSLKCWGSNGSGRLGDGTTTDRSIPAAVDLGDGRTATAVGLGHSHTCAILDDDSLKCWGDNGSGQLGDGTTTDRSIPAAVDLGDGRTATAISLGDDHTCAILDDDSLKCWGSNGFGRLGDGTNAGRRSPTAVGLGDGRTAKAIGLGQYHTCAILEDNSLKCWGSNGSGRLGDGTTTHRSTPTAVNLGDGRTAKAIALGDEHTCVILNDDTLECWGRNDVGETGIATEHIGDSPNETGNNLPVVNLD